MRGRRLLTVHLPRVGIVAALGVATVLAPLFQGAVTGSRAADAVAAPRLVQAESAQALAWARGSDGTGGPAQAPPAGAQAHESRTPRPASVTDPFSVVPVEASTGHAVGVASEVPAMGPEELAASRAEAERASRDLFRPVLPGCDGVVRGPAAENGRLAVEDLCGLWQPGHYLRADAAVALAKLNVAYQEHFGVPLAITDSYRSYGQQVSVKARKPGLAAVPGTSEHGWALAVDLGGGVEGAGEPYQWLRANAPAFGWDNPGWAQAGGSGAYEPWHWEYVAGQQPAQG
ncbi:MAG: D-alanyl-D-alanine carboxypeptidase family protein [Actinomycetes bacterium]